MTQRESVGSLPDPREQPTLNLWPETARILGITKDSVYGAAHRGEIPTLRLGRRIVVPTARLLDLLGLGGGEAA